ncbi:lipoyl(octanoyl) transferase LipB [Poriferisphaera sp. WC338]|uniref:lipoyl(octanoyl) transferase LipB n=1 Tax=Poriferisphaera sp. WC338 TaxID=3425129 RepID=UPI003D81912F
MNTQPDYAERLDVGGEILRVMQYDRLSYADGLAKQRKFLEQVIEYEGAEHVLLFLEHDPVITIPPKEIAQQHLVASVDHLAKLGIEVCETDRGGDITYHGPGQLVAYPILKMSKFGLNLSKYMRLLEQVVIGTLKAYGIKAHREPGATGVWVRPSMESNAVDESSHDAYADLKHEAGKGMSGVSEKICAMGVRIRKNVTMHGLALNLSTDLTHFQTIVPCGLAGRPVTSMNKILGDAAPSMQTLMKEMTAHFAVNLEKAIQSDTKGV